MDTVRLQRKTFKDNFHQFRIYFTRTGRQSKVLPKKLNLNLLWIIKASKLPPSRCFALIAADHNILIFFIVHTSP